MEWLAFLSRFIDMALEFLGWRRKVDEQEHAQAIADSPETKDELVDRWEKGDA
jgi:hypothetical protein